MLSVCATRFLWSLCIHSFFVYIILNSTKVCFLNKPMDCPFGGLAHTLGLLWAGQDQGVASALQMC